MKTLRTAYLMGANTLLLAALTCAIGTLAHAQSDGVPEKLGTVYFPVSCNAQAQRQMT